MASIKLIVSNRGALKAKYGAVGVAAIDRALGRLARADRRRGLTLKRAWIDRAASLRGTGARRVANAGDEVAVKQAIDGLARRWKPDYFVLLGAPDVVPHQQLVNPVFDPKEEEGDLDKTVPSDLPYACDAAFARDIGAFKAATRVVGRLPDLVGARDPAYLVDLIDKAAAAIPLPGADYQAYFALSNDSWRRSTALTLRRIFGTDAAMHRVPPEAPPWSAAQVHALAHFVNCHGAEADDHFYGEEDKEKDPAQPVSLSTRDVAGKVRTGTVAAMECCYGAQLFDPKANRGRPGLANAYLAAGAYGCFGSTTVAYGPAAGNGSADLLTRFFLKGVLGGRSLGRATLEARQEFARGGGDLDPVDLKTLGQFILLGDPSIQAVAKEATDLPKAFRRLVAKSPAGLQRRVRRQRLADQSDSLDAVPVARLARNASADAAARKLKRLAATIVQGAHVRRFETVRASGRSIAGRQMHLVVGTQRSKKGRRPVAFVVRHFEGRIAKIVALYGKSFLPD